MLSGLFGKKEPEIKAEDLNAEELIVRGDLHGVPLGSYELNGYSGKVNLLGSDCEVSNADIVIHVDPCEKIYSGVFPSHWIEWNGGEVVSGSLNCRMWNDGVFNGESLKVSGEFRGGEFNGSEFYANEVSGGLVGSGDAVCNCWSRARFSGKTLNVKIDFQCGSFDGGAFDGVWNDGVFKGGIFNGEWHGGTWKGGEWQGECFVGDGTFESVKRD